MKHLGTLEKRVTCRRLFLRTIGPAQSVLLVAVLATHAVCLSVQADDGASSNARSQRDVVQAGRDVENTTQLELSRLLGLDPSDRLDGLRDLVTRGPREAAVIAARTLIRDDAVAMANTIASECTEWSTQHQNALLAAVSETRMRSEFRSFLAIPRRVLLHCIESRNCETDNADGVNQIALSAQCLAASADERDHALVVRAVSAYPTEPWVWLALSTFEDSRIEYEDEASETWHNNGRPLVLRVAAAVSIATPDASARQFALSSIQNVLDRYSNQRLADAFPGLGVNRAVAKAYYEFRASLRLVAMLRFLSGPAAERMGVDLLEAQNEQLRALGEIIVAIRWPQLINGKRWEAVEERSQPRVAALLRVVHGNAVGQFPADISVADIHGWREKLTKGGLSSVFGISGTLVAVP